MSGSDRKNFMKQVRIRLKSEKPVNCDGESKSIYLGPEKQINGFEEDNKKKVKNYKAKNTGLKPKLQIDNFEENNKKKNNNSETKIKGRGRKPASASDKQNIAEDLKFETKNYILSSVQHHTIPSLNLNLKGISLKRLSETRLFTCSQPETVFVSLAQPNSLDICHRRTMAYCEYNRCLINCNTRFTLAEKKKYIRKNIKKNIYPNSVIEYAELLESNPDPYFQGNYDWYFTGGNLFYDNDSNLLANATGSNLQELVISKFKKRNAQHFIKRISTIDYSNLLINEYNIDNKYLEILEIQQMKSLKNRYLIRQKNAVSICTHDEENLVNDVVIPNFNIKKSAPFITAASHLYQPDIMLTGNLNRTVHLWNLKQSNMIPNTRLLKFSSNEDNWNQLKNYDQNTFAFATGRYLYLLDIRLSPDEINKNKFYLKNNLYECESITSMQISDFSNCIYLGSTHRIFSVDPRYILNDSVTDTNFFLQTWTHQMKLPPLMLKSFNFVENYDIIVASSPLSSDLRFIENTRKVRNDTESILSSSLPYMPPSLTYCYQNAKKIGECLDPTTNLETRIKSSVCGLDFYKRGSKIYIAFSNSLGDIFTQQLNFENEEIDTRKKNSIIKYNNNIKMNLMDQPEVLTVTDIKDLSGIKKILRCNYLNNANQEDNENFSEVPENIPQIKRPKWQSTIKQLSKYKDVLAQDLLAIWEFQCESDEDTYDIKDQLKKIKNENKLNASIKVESWLENSIIDNNDTKLLDFTADNIFSSTQVTQHKYEVEDVTFENTIGIEDSKEINLSTIIHSTLTPRTRKLLEENSELFDNLNNADTAQNSCSPAAVKKRKKIKKEHVLGF